MGQGPPCDTVSLQPRRRARGIENCAQLAGTAAEAQARSHRLACCQQLCTVSCGGQAAGCGRGAGTRCGAWRARPPPGPACCTWTRPPTCAGSGTEGGRRRPPTLLACWTISWAALSGLTGGSAGMRLFSSAWHVHVSGHWLLGEFDAAWCASRWRYILIEPTFNCVLSWGRGYSATNGRRQ